MATKKIDENLKLLERSNISTMRETSLMLLNRYKRHSKPLNPRQLTRMKALESIVQACEVLDLDALSDEQAYVP